MMAVVRSPAELTTLFEQDGTGMPSDQETLQAGLWRAFWGGDVEIAKALIDTGADVNLGLPDPNLGCAKRYGNG